MNVHDSRRIEEPDASGEESESQNPEDRGDDVQKDGHSVLGVLRIVTAMGALLERYKGNGPSGVVMPSPATRSSAPPDPSAPYGSRGTRAWPCDR